MKLPFPLLADPQGLAARAYGVYGAYGMKVAARVTFVIGPDGRVIKVIDKDAIDPTAALEACPLKKPAAKGG